MVNVAIKKSRGFTLIELMLASALLMTIMFSGYYAYSLYTQKWQKRVDTYWQSINQGVGVDALTKLLQSTSKYIVENEDGKLGVYFEASNEVMRFISNSPIMSSGSALVELEIVENNGYKKLIYREMNLQGSPLYFLSEVENNSSWHHQIVLLDKLTEVSWLFYGWTTFQNALTQVGITEITGNEDTRVNYQLHEPDKIRVLPVHVNLRISVSDQLSELKVDFPNHSVFSVVANARSGA